MDKDPCTRATLEPAGTPAVKYPKLNVPSKTVWPDLSALYWVGLGIVLTLFIIGMLQAPLAA